MNKLEQLRWIKELALSADDPLYFLSNYATCQHPTHGHFPYIPHDYQRTYIEELNKGNVIVNARRQAGLSLTTMMYLFWYGMFNPDATIGMTSHKFISAKENLQMIRYAYMNLPDPMKELMPLRVNNKTEIQLDNGTTFLARAPTDYAFRGMGLTLLHLDNFAYLSNQKQEDFLCSIMPVMQACRTSKMFITSSGDPYTMTSPFYDLFDGAENDRNNFTAIKMI